MVSVSDYGTYYTLYYFFFFFYSVIMQNKFIQVIWNYINYKTNHSLTFYIELSSKSVGVGLNLTILNYLFCLLWSLYLPSQLQRADVYPIRVFVISFVIIWDFFNMQMVGREFALGYFIKRLPIAWGSTFPCAFPLDAGFGDVLCTYLSLIECSIPSQTSVVVVFVVLLAMVQWRGGLGFMNLYL